jgi:hypothetical protein
MEVQQLSGSIWENVINDITDNWPYLNIPIIDEEYPCLHDTFDQQLVSNGQCQTLAEARKQPRHLSCSCPKCTVRY